jgi:hypothetical protein
MSDGQRPKFEVKYLVMRQFKYNGVMQEPGTEWFPIGAPFDAKLIDQGKYVQRQEVAVEAAEQARRGRGRPKKAEAMEV